ncbi:HEPN domain-containing protein [Pseudoalteromonas sp. G4]|uniref:HEPN domain-containing protein n=1 Tax=Pseudoalteromonas sp. G4 TaxID=2992761 RepID=UPI00237D8311|nr:HEPN domain-containing protein [Pseudoalteromonas sp. G4]MDE3273291.1 HEPN domain-containing protein [Pseudoalteromonas sp. G4]
MEGSTLANYVNRKANEEMKRFFNPNSEKTKKLFIEFFHVDVDVTKSWNWDNYQSPQAKKMLNNLISKRGVAAHVAKTELHSPDSIKRNDLDKTIRFLKGLVTSMEQQKIVIPFL